jgi:hypothetical protein
MMHRRPGPQASFRANRHAVRIQESHGLVEAQRLVAIRKQTPGEVTDVSGNA